MSILRNLWAAYAVILFLFMMLVLTLPVILFHMVVSPGEPALRKNLHFLYHWFTPLFLWLIGVRLVVTGAELLNPNRATVIIGNHRSALDFIVNCHAWPGLYRYLAKSELTGIPIFGWVVKKTCLLVDRSSAMSRARSMVALKQSLESGWSIFIYPEGSRNKTNEAVGPFYDGAFRLAIQSKAPLAVVVIKNIGSITSSSVDLWPGTLYIHWCAVIETTGYHLDQVNELKEYTRALMAQHLKERC